MKTPLPSSSKTTDTVLRLGSARVPRAVFGVAPKTFPHTVKGRFDTRSLRQEQSAGCRLRRPERSRSPFQRRFSTSAFLFLAALTVASLLLLCPISANAQGGVPLWTNRYNGLLAPAGSMAVDRSGNVLVIGNSFNADTTNLDYVTIKYSNSGVPLWTNWYHGPANQDNVASGSATAIAVDSSDNVLVTGYSLGTANPDYDYATIKYSSAGVALWTNRFDAGVKGFDGAHAIAVDSSGNVFVTGESWDGSSYDFATIKYSETGVPLWTNYYVGPNGLSDVPVALAVDGGGNVIVTGYSSISNVSPSYDSDYVTIKYSSAGDLLWINYYSGPGLSQETEIPLPKMSPPQLQWTTATMYS